MGFLLLFFSGILGGILGGMGMGGGTLLIPLLTLLCGVEQRVAQGLNLLSFLPMSLLALREHGKRGLVEKEGLLSLTLPAVLFSALFSLVATALPSQILRKFFGVFLVVLSFFQLKFAFKREEKG